MKIKEVTYHNFKSISQDCALSVETKITPLVGASETGKTNILEALNKFFTSGAFNESDICTFSEPIADDSYMVSVTFKLEDFDREKVSKIDERLGEASEFTVRKQKDGHYVLEESGLRERKPKDPQPPSRLIELHDIIWQGLERVNALFDQFYTSLPAGTPKHQAARQTFDKFIKHMPLGGSPTRSTDAKEREFLQIAGDLLSAFSTEIDQLPNVPEELKAIITDLQSKIVEAIGLPYEVPPRQEIDPNQLLELCPHTLYIKDADVQLPPDSIPIYQLEAGAEQASIYQSLLRIANISIANLKDTETTRRERKLRHGAGKVNKFLEQWTQEKIEATLSVDQANFLFHLTGKEGHYGKLSDRSEGFRWFLSFCLSYGLPLNSSDGYTLLLDEPGLHLHASAQKDLLELFESMAKSCQIIYTTHSPFMINKNYPERIRGVLKGKSPEGTTIDNKPYRPAKGGCYKPIRTSIGITLGNSLFIGGSNLIVEGIADQIILTAFSRYLARQDKQPFINLQDICITPAGGADNVPYFAYLCKIEDMKTVVLLDNDKEGENAVSRITREQLFPPEKVVRVRNAVTKSKDAIVELEDLINPEFYHSAFLEAYKELPNIEFFGGLPKTYEEMTQQPKSSIKQGVEKEAMKRHPTSKAITVLYSELFEKHRDKRWGCFDKVLVAKRIAQKLEDGDIPDDKNKTISNFTNLFKTINDGFK